MHKHVQGPTANDDDQFRTVTAKYNLAVMLLNSGKVVLLANLIIALVWLRLSVHQMHVNAHG